MFFKKKKKTAKLEFEIVTEGDEYEVGIGLQFGGDVSPYSLATLINMINQGNLHELIVKNIELYGKTQNDPRVPYVLENLVDPNKKSNKPLVPPIKILGMMHHEGVYSDGIHD